MTATRYGGVVLPFEVLVLRVLFETPEGGDSDALVSARAMPGHKRWWRDEVKRMAERVAKRLTTSLASEVERRLLAGRTLLGFGPVGDNQ